MKRLRSTSRQSKSTRRPRPCSWENQILTNKNSRKSTTKFVKSAICLAFSSCSKKTTKLVLNCSKKQKYVQKTPISIFQWLTTIMLVFTKLWESIEWLSSSSKKLFILKRKKIWIRTFLILFLTFALFCQSSTSTKKPFKLVSTRLFWYKKNCWITAFPSCYPNKNQKPKSKTPNNNLSLLIFLTHSISKTSHKNSSHLPISEGKRIKSKA